MQGSFSQGHDKHRDKWCSYGNFIFSISFFPLNGKNRHLSGCSARLRARAGAAEGKLSPGSHPRAGLPLCPVSLQCSLGFMCV